MSFEDVTNDSHRKRRYRFIFVGAVVLAIVIGLAVVLGVTVKNLKKPDSFKNVVIGKCETYLKENTNLSGYSDCETIWQVFEQAYVGRDPCDVPPEAYYPLINLVKNQLACNTMLFWSKTKTLVHEFTENRECLVTLEDTLLGFTFNELTWCSKNQSKETFTTDCPLWSYCVNNPVRSFWIKASANFAAIACGNVSTMLNGSLESPFSSTSIFGDVEVRNLDSTKVHSLTVLLVTKDTDMTTCENASFKDLQSALNPNITYNCREVPLTTVQGCISNLDIPCSDCFKKGSRRSGLVWNTAAKHSL
ncbi:hypothetical protein P4O66_004956 [Electrophorus voltai]|uniref:ADP-ribosyl cyclase/cyclic ADP-ribose hydrolase n=1 Tax=Electrophorus voltai TaxID=2609070 RepID=A0AAD8ZW68_9TELE|nr:hypothetical protein P4O66_004956 [Electrophorus voltai]